MSALATPPLVSLEGVGKLRTQGDSSFELWIPRFSVAAGQLVAVVGDSGCGKSTLLDMLALVMAPTRVGCFEMDFSGAHHDIQALWASSAEAKLAALRRDFLGYILQTGGLLPFLTVRDNIALPGRLKGQPDNATRITQMAERLGVAGCLGRFPRALSIGQRQRAAILRALVHRPRLVLADEPTAAVDKTRARHILEDLAALAREDGVAVIVVTHDVDLVVEHADLAYTFHTEQISATRTRSLCRPTRLMVS